MSATGQPVLPRADRIRYEEVAADLKKHYEATGSRDLKEYARRVQHLDRFFTGRRIAAIGQPVVDAYIVRRQEEPKEGPPREGFFERDQYEAVRRLLSADLQAAVAIAYTCGWRMQSEVLTLERRQLDLEAGTLRLEPGTTKNDEGRVDQEGVGGRVRGGRRPGDAPPRLPAHRRAQHGQRWRPGARGHEGDGPQDARGVRPLPHCQPGRSPGRRPEAFGHVSGHVGECYDRRASHNSLIFQERADSSVGRARPLQGRGHRFDPCSAHH